MVEHYRNSFSEGCQLEREEVAVVEKSKTEEVVNDWGDSGLHSITLGNNLSGVTGFRKTFM